MSLRSAPQLSSVLVAGALLAAATSARADLPPPNGTKFVGFAFEVDDLAAVKDFVLLAYPCGSSNGAPIAEMAELKEGTPVSVGRRGGDCQLYAMARADFDEWRKGVTGNQGAAVDALFKSPRVRACTGGPEHVYTLPISDSRSTVTQTLHVAQLDANGCSITSAASGAGTAPTTTGPTETPPVNRGCAGCSVPPAPPGPGALAATLSLVALASRRRGRSRG
jgi:MYXO-CTERM domain-containing protein